MSTGDGHAVAARCSTGITLARSMDVSCHYNTSHQADCLGYEHDASTMSIVAGKHWKIRVEDGLAEEAGCSIEIASVCCKPAASCKHRHIFPALTTGNLPSQSDHPGSQAQKMPTQCLALMRGRPSPQRSHLQDCGAWCTDSGMISPKTIQKRCRQPRELWQANTEKSEEVITLLRRHAF